MQALLLWCMLGLSAVLAKPFHRWINKTVKKQQTQCLLVGNPDVSVQEGINNSSGSLNDGSSSMESAPPICPRQTLPSVGQTALSAEVAKPVEKVHSHNGGGQSVFSPEEITAVIDTLKKVAAYYQEKGSEGNGDTPTPITLLASNGKGGWANQVGKDDIPSHSEEVSGSGNNMIEQSAIGESNQTADLSKEEELKKVIALGLENGVEHNGTTDLIGDESNDELEKALALSMETPSAQLLVIDVLARAGEPSHLTFGSQEEPDAVQPDSSTMSLRVTDAHGQLDVDASMTEVGKICDDADTAAMVYDLIFQSSFVSLKQFLIKLALHCISLYERSGEPGYVDKSLKFIGGSRAASGSAHDASVDNLEGQVYCLRFKRCGDLDDVHRAIGSFNKALEFVDNDDCGTKAALLSNKAECLVRRFQQLGGLGDLDQAMETLQQAIGLVADGNASKPTWLGNLGICLRTRFQRFGDLGDLDQAVKTLQQAVDLTPNGHACKSGWLNNLGVSLRTRFERFGDLNDLDQAVRTQQQAVNNTPDRHADKPGWLNSLGISLRTRFERSGDLGDLDQAVKTHQQAVDITPDGHPSIPLLLGNLGNTFLRRFERLGDLGDLDQAVKTHQRAVDLTPHGHASKPSWLGNLGISLRTRFEWLGDLGDLDQAVKTQMQAVDLTPDGHFDKPSWLTNLGISLGTRFERLGDLDDLHQAVRTLQQAINLTPDGHPSKTGWLNNLGISLATRFRRLGDLSDLDQTVIIHQQAVDLTPDGHADKPGRLSNLGISFKTRFETLGDLGDLDQAVRILQQAIDLTPDGQPSKTGWLSNLGISLATRFQRLGDFGDLDQAVITHQQATDLTPDGHADKSGRLLNLANSLQIRLLQRPTPQDRSTLIFSLHTAASNPHAPPSVRFNAARKLAKLLHPQLQPYQIAIDLIPQVVWQGRTIAQRYNDLERLGDLVMNAFSAACAQVEYDLALEWAEQARTIIWRQVLQLRSPMDKLQVDYPDLAYELNRIAKGLDLAATASAGFCESASAEEAAQEHRRLAKKWEETLAFVRKLPNFADFLKPKLASVLKHAFADRTIVLINVSHYHSDALILQPGSGSSISISHIPLPTLSDTKVNKARDELINALRQSGVRYHDTGRGSALKKTGSIPKILEMLWNDAAKPILDHLGHATPQPTGDLPHITWCLIGALAALPLHAAGIYTNTSANDKLYNYVVSSYTTSLTSLVEGLERTPTTPRARSLLAVTQHCTPELPSLPATMREIDHVETTMKIYNIDVTRMDDDQATVKNVSDAMNDHSWIHFACHAKQDATDPTKSAFLLHDGSLELIDVMRKPLKQAEMAYLSTCQSASGHYQLPDEAIHLAAGMFTAGYQTVIATLWSIIDTDAPIVAQEFYDRLLNNPDGGAARALHEAVGVLREQVGEENLLRWVPYIHMGC